MDPRGIVVALALVVTVMVAGAPHAGAKTTKKCGTVTGVGRYCRTTSKTGPETYLISTDWNFDPPRDLTLPGIGSREVIELTVHCKTKRAGWDVHYYGSDGAEIVIPADFQDDMMSVTSMRLTAKAVCKRFAA